MGFVGTGLIGNVTVKQVAAQAPALLASSGLDLRVAGREGRGGGEGGGGGERPSFIVHRLSTSHLLIHLTLEDRPTDQLAPYMHTYIRGVTYSVDVGCGGERNLPKNINRRDDPRLCTGYRGTLHEQRVTNTRPIEGCDGGFERAVCASWCAWTGGGDDSDPQAPRIASP